MHCVSSARMAPGFATHRAIVQAAIRRMPIFDPFCIVKAPIRAASAATLGASRPRALPFSSDNFADSRLRIAYRWALNSRSMPRHPGILCGWRVCEIEFLAMAWADLRLNGSILRRGHSHHLELRHRLSFLRRPAHLRGRDKLPILMATATPFSSDSRRTRRRNAAEIHTTGVPTVAATAATIDLSWRRLLRSSESTGRAGSL